MTRLVLAGLALGAVGVLVAAVLGEQLLAGVYGPAYAQESWTFVVVMLAAGLSAVASFCGFALTAARFLRSLAVLLVLVVLAVATTSHLLVPREGIVGAAWALVVGSGVQVAGALLLVVVSVRTLRAQGAGTTTAAAPSGGSRA